MGPRRVDNSVCSVFDLLGWRVVISKLIAWGPGNWKSLVCVRFHLTFLDGPFDFRIQWISQTEAEELGIQFSSSRFFLRIWSWFANTLICAFFLSSIPVKLPNTMLLFRILSTLSHLECGSHSNGRKANKQTKNNCRMLSYLSKRFCLLRHFVPFKSRLLHQLSNMLKYTHTF